MSHQDWKPVVFTKNREYTKEEQEKFEKKKIEKLEKKKEEENEIKAPAKVSFELKKAIMQARLSKKLTQKELATRLNVPINTISGYESGKIVPNNSFIVKMERILGTKLPRVSKQK